MLALLTAPLVLAAPARANDAIFPAEGGAADRIGWDGNYFVVDGEPVVLSSGEIHYARVPRELWRDRLVKAKRAGLNTISTYSFWNAHEPAEGVFDFSDNLDLDAWLSLIEELGMYAIVRPGPYNCAEWLSGGIPQWITAKPGMQIRTDYAAYVAAADAYYDAILPIIAEHQLHRGGSVLLVQLENEHPDGWGTDSNPFLRHLYDKARALGLEVPLFYSGLHHSSDPAGNTPFGDRNYPWFSTEFWSGWFGIGGGEMDASQLNTLARGAAKVIAFGGAGNTFYVFHGGTNLGYSADGRDASYDYRAPLGEQGQLRQGYFAVRRPNAFARAFETLLATSRDGRNLVSEVASGISTYVRRSPTDGIAVFLDNQGSSPIQTQVALSDPALRFPAGSTQLTVAPNEIRPVVADAPWTDNATFAYLATSILGQVTLGTTTYFVGYGRAGEAGEIAVQYATAPAAVPTDGWTWDDATRVARATFEYPDDDGILELPIDSGDGASAVFLIVNSGLSERTWFTDEAIFVGPTYVNEDLSLEVPTTGAEVVIYAADGRLEVSAPPVAAPAGIELGDWQWRDAAAEAAVDFPDSTWASSTQPQPFGAYGFQNGYGWYRARFTAASAGSLTVDIEGMRAAAMAFANGEQVPVNGNRVTFDTVSGEVSVHGPKRRCRREQPASGGLSCGAMVGRRDGAEGNSVGGASPSRRAWQAVATKLRISRCCCRSSER